MAVIRLRKSIAEMLLEPDALERLRHRFRFIEDNLTTTIHEASDLTDLTEAQLRYAELRGMLVPNRSDLPDADGGKGQRRYSVDHLLRAHLIAFLLDREYSFPEIAAFMQSNPDVIHEVLQTSTVRLKSAIEAIDAIQFCRYVVPRMLYYALSLIFERDAIANAGIVFPVRADPAQLEQLNLRREEADGEAANALDDITAGDLGQFGQMLFAWRPASGPLISILSAGDPFEREQRVILRPLTKLLPQDAPHVSRREASQIFIAFEPQVERELDEATRTFQLRQSRGPGYANPRVVAARLIVQAQRIFGRRLAQAGDEDLEGAKTLFYAAPELTNPALGDALLNKLTETLVELGGASDEVPSRRRWRFACVLTPREPYTPLKYQELVVRAQSSESPHRINVTTTAHERNGGLTFRAFSSGRIAYRKELTPLDPAVSYVEIEEPIKSAVAVPTLEGVGGGHNQSPAILYITSEDEKAFAHDDMLLFRAMGRLVGEIVVTYNSRGHRPSTLTDALVDPEIVDPFFSEFPSDSDFTSELMRVFGEIKRQLSQKKRAKTEPAAVEVKRRLIIVGLDINDYTTIETQRGKQIARILTRELGLRAKQRMESSFIRAGVTAKLYHSYADRFVMLIQDERQDGAQIDVRAYAERIRQNLNSEYYLEGENVLSVRSRPSPNRSDGISVSVRMAGMDFSQDDLKQQLEDVDDVDKDIAACVAGLARMIDDGLQQASELRGRALDALWWDLGEHRWATFASLPSEPGRPPSSSGANADGLPDDSVTLFDRSDPRILL